MKRLLIGLTLLLAPLSGCCTLGQSAQREGPAVFGGVRLDAKLLALTGGKEPTMIGLVLLDLPLSLTLDTLLLPFSIPNEIEERGIETEWGIDLGIPHT